MTSPVATFSAATRGRAVADVVVGPSLGQAGLHGQQRLGAVQGLDLALLVDAAQIALIRPRIVSASAVQTNGRGLRL